MHALFIALTPCFWLRRAGFALAAWGLSFALWAQTTPGVPTPTEKPVTPPQAVAFGTGFSLGEGYILTAHHVIRQANSILVGTGQTQRWTLAEIVKQDPVLDLALLKVRVAFPAVTFANSNLAPTGLEITVIGYPQPGVQGLTPKITQGLINGSQSERSQSMDRGYFQISAEISKGNSGGPLISADGLVLGMVQRKIDTQRIMDRTQDLMVNVSYALRSSQILSFLEGTPVTPQVKPLNVSNLLRPYQIFEQLNPSVVAILGRNTPLPSN